MAKPTAPGSEEYILGEPLGRGLTSDLFHGQYGDAGVAVLLKRFKYHDTERMRLTKLRWQVLWAGAERHPGLAWMRAIQEDESGRRILILESAGDETLERFLQRNDKGVQAGEALLIVRRLAEALRQAAKLGFDYRFLQPATIMLEGETNPLLLGLDLAGQFDLQVLAIEAPAAQAAFLAPEQRNGEGSDESSLIYSLGVLLAALMVPAWLFGEGGQGPDRPVEPPAAVLAALQDEVTPQTFALLQVAIQRKPASRYKDLNAFLEAAYAAELVEAPDHDRDEAAAASQRRARGWKPSSVPKGVAGATGSELAERALPPVSAEVTPFSPAMPAGDAYRSRDRRTPIPLFLLYLLLATAAAGTILLVLEPEILDRVQREDVATDGSLPPSPTLFNLGVPSTPVPVETTPAFATATRTESATSTATDIPLTSTRATATATRPSPTPTRLTATETPSPSPSPTANVVIIIPSPTVLILPTDTPPPPTEPAPPPPPTEPPPPPATEPPPPPPTSTPPSPPTPTEAPPVTPTAPSP